VQQSSQPVGDNEDDAIVKDRRRHLLLHDDRGSSSLVGNRRALFETLAAADCTDDVKASKKALRPVTLKMADPPPMPDEKTVVVSDDNDSGVIVVSDKKESSGGDTKTSSVSVSGSRETLSDVVDEPCKEEVAMDTSEDNQRPVVVPPTSSSSPTGPAESSETTDDDSPPPPTPSPLNDHVLVADGLPESPTSFSPAVVLLSGDLKPPAAPSDKELDAHVVESPPVGIPICSSSLSDDLKQVLERPFAAAVAAAASNDVDEQAPVESPEDLEIKTLANKLLKMDYYESNNTGVPVPSPRKKIKSPIKITNYPENLNPFDDEDEDDEKNKTSNTNPFGSDLEDEDDVSVTKTYVSLNPFSSDEDENETRAQPPPPLPKPR